MQPRTGASYEFGAFTVDPVKRVLLRDAAPVSLTSKAFDTLFVLVQRSGQTVSKDELLRLVWSDSVVEENNLTQSISALRKALGEHPQEHRYIVTVPGQGYRFVADVREQWDGPDATVELVLEKHTKLHLVREDEEETDGEWADETLPARRPRLTKRDLIVTAAVLIGAAIGVSLYESAGRGSPAAKRSAPFERIQMAKLTTAGNSLTAAISPDGKYAAYVAEEGGRQSLWLRRLDAARAVPIVPPADVEYWGLTFAHDGGSVYYVAWERNRTSDAALYVVPVLGGASRKLLTSIDTPVTLAPDEQRFAYAIDYPSVGESRLVVADVDGGNTRILARRKHPDTFTTYARGGPAWSPDGTLIACAVSHSGPDGRYMGVVIIRVADGRETPMTSHRWQEVGRVEWLADGSGIVAAAREQASSSRQIWYVPYPQGEARKITTDLNDYRGVSLTADSRTLLAVQSEQISNIWVAPDGDVGQAKQIASEVAMFDGSEGLSWTPDGRIVYRSVASGNWDLWSINADGSGPRQLTFAAGTNFHPAVSSDGRSILFASNQTGAFRIWKMDADGGNRRQLTSGPANGPDHMFPQLSPDGTWVVYQNGFGMVSTNVWKVPTDGGTPARLIDRSSYRPTISPDGKLVAYFTIEAHEWFIGVVPITGGQPIKRFSIAPSVISRILRWAPDGRALAYIDDGGGVSNIWKQPLDGSPPTQFTNFKTDRMFSFAWSRDGRYLACTRGLITNDVVRISAVN